jgi:hypothetical protein
VIPPRRRRILPVFTLGVLCAMLIAAPGARGGIDAQRFRDDLKQLCAPPTRITGSEGYAQSADFLEREIKSLPNVEVRRHEYPVMVPVTREAVLRAGDRTERIYPFWPASVRVNATPADGITGRCVYVAGATFDTIKPADLAGQIAVVDASAGTWWTNAFYFGAKAVLILSSPETNNADLRSHELLAPANLPRFYIPPGQLAGDLRAGRITGDVTLKVSVDWQRTMAVNLYALVRPRQPIAGWAPKSPPGALMISVPFDSTGLVPDLANGASQATQAASGLAILRDLATHPLDRPVVLFFGGADGIQMLATRNMFMALSDPPAIWKPQTGDLDDKIAGAKRDADRLHQVAGDPAQLDPSRDRAAIDRIATLVQTDLAMDQELLFRLRREGALDADRIKQLVDRQYLLNRLQYSFIQNPKALTNELAEPAKGFVREALDRLEGTEKTGGLIRQDEARRTELQSRIDLYQWLAAALGKSTDPGLRTNDNRLIELLVALDFSDRGARCGPMFIGRYQNFTNISQVQDYRDWFSRQERRFTDKDPAAQWWGDLRGLVDFDPFVGARSPTTWLCAPMAIGSELCQAWGVPGFSMITLDDLRLRRDTPTDTLANLNVDAILPQLDATYEVLRHAWNDPNFRGQPDYKWQRTQFTGQVVSPAPGKPVPDLPRQGFLATYYYTVNNLPHIPQPKPLPWAMGVRRNEVRDTDAEGNYRFEGMPRLGSTAANEMQIFAVEVFHPEPGSGAITAATDLGKQQGDLKIYADIRQDLDPMRNVVFACEEFALVGLYDPRFLQNLGEVLPLDARRNADPQRYNAVVCNQLMAGFVEPGSLTSLLFRYGRVGNRLILVDMPSHLPPLPPGEGRGEGARGVDTRLTTTHPHPNPLPEGEGTRTESAATHGRGYLPAQLDNLGPLALVTSTDFHRLDQIRLDEYRRAGVSSSLIDSMQSDAGKKLDAARVSLKANDGAALMEHATGAWANNARVYSATQDMANDVVRGAIFLLLLCVPFSFCMERLLIATPNIYKQIAGAAGIFAIMTAALWSFHPAFKISSSPLIIVLAFAIILMSGVVMFVVYGRFDTELKKISSGRGSAGSVDFARASVLASAVLLGIANMRKRKFRTLLTSITIVLITFAVLCFTSAAKFLDTSTLPTGQTSTYPGVMLRQRGYRPLPEIIVQNLRPLLPGRTLVERWWNANPNDPRDQIHLIAKGQDSQTILFAATAALGLSPGESKLSPIADVIGPEKFARLERGERNIIYLSSAIADPLQVKEGDSVRVGGIDLQVAGVFDADAFDQKVITLSGDPLSPLKYASGALDADGRLLSDTSAAEAFSLDANAAGGELGATYEHLSSSNFVIVPAAISKLLPNAALRSVAARVSDAPIGDATDAAVRQTSDELARRFAVALFAGYSDGVRMVSSSNLTSVSGAGQVAIPLLIAGLIIFNTMMGSIAERKREIHVYTSLGLAPLHVGALFVAEAMTYGLIGTVFGYVIGQGVGTLLLKLGWLGHVTMNYSGTAAILTMGLILLIVLLSALVPARLASRLAAPSIERAWRVPLPADGQILANLPFTINKTAADGALAYLAEFFDAHREGSIGKFSAGKVEVFDAADTTGRPAHGIKTTIWLTPFDLGVRQNLSLLIHPGEYENIYEVRVILSRLSGDDGSWYRMNRTFLTELRKQFLQWRSLSPQRMIAYVETSRALFRRPDAVSPDAAASAASPAGA